MQKSTYKNHEIWNQLALAENAIEQVFIENQTDERAIALKKQIEYVRWVLEQSDCLLIGQQLLASIQSPITQIAQHAKDLGHYQSVENWFGSIFTVFPYPRIQKIFRSETNRIIEDFTTLVNRLTEETSTIRNEVKASREDTAQLAIQANDELIAVQSKLAECEAAIDQKRTDFETSVNTLISEKMGEFTDRFSNGQSERSGKFQQALDEISTSLRETEKNRESLKGKYAGSIVLATEKLNSKLVDFEGSATETLEKLNGFYNKAGQDALAADFAGNSVKEDKRFSDYSKIAAIFFILAAIILGIMWLSLAQNDTFDFAQLFMRVPVSIVFLLPAFYFASLASSHRKSAIKLRSLGLRIKSFGAYVTPADKLEQVALRAEMVKEFFAEEINEPQKNGVFDRNVNKSVERVVGLAEKIVEKVPKG